MSDMTTKKTQAKPKAKPKSDAVAKPPTPLPLSNPDCEATVEFMAGLFGISTSMVRKNAQARGWQKFGRNRYHLASAVKDYVVMKEEQTAAAMDRGSSGDKETEEIRKIAAQARNEEVKLATTMSELVHIEKVEKIWADHIARAKARLLSLPGKAAPVVADMGDARKVREYLDNMIGESLDELKRETNYAKGPEGDVYIDDEGKNG